MDSKQIKQRLEEIANWIGHDAFLNVVVDGLEEYKREDHPDKRVSEYIADYIEEKYGTISN